MKYFFTTNDELKAKLKLFFKNIDIIKVLQRVLILIFVYYISFYTINHILVAPELTEQSAQFGSLEIFGFLSIYFRY
jgi:hypothetical protein